MLVEVRLDRARFSRCADRVFGASAADTFGLDWNYHRVSKPALGHFAALRHATH